MAVEVSEPPQCCVTPIAQRIQTFLDAAISRATALSFSAGMPVNCSAYSIVNGSRLLRYRRNRSPIAGWNLSCEDRYQ